MTIRTLHSNCNTIIFLRRELWSSKYLTKVFESSFKDLYLASRTWQNLHILFPRKQKTITIMQNMYSERFLKDSIKLLWSPFPVMLQTFFTRRALKGHSWVTQRALNHSIGTLRAFQAHLDTQGDRDSSTWGIWALKGYLSSRALNALGHLGTRALEAVRHLKFTWMLRHSC